jgi:hypothetical protein
VDVNIKAGEAGLGKNHPIVLDDDEPEAGPSNARRPSNVKAEPSGSSRRKGNTASEIGDEIAEAQVRVSGLWLCFPVTHRVLAIQKKLEELKQRKRAAESGQEDNKENILKQASKKLKMAKEKDNGFVDLTVDDD